MPSGAAVCEHAFLTSEGHPYARFRRALDCGNATEALSAAAELHRVGLTEALELCLILVDGPFEGRLTTDEIRAVAAFVVESVEKSRH